MKEHFLEKVNNYTKYKIVEMLIEKHKGKSLNNLNAIEEIADNILDVLAICGLKFYGDMSNAVSKKNKDNED
tara:strand:- start:368 stop:583 length:216 start_codon:yes stop_codon:yes gene_type:complete